MELWSGFFGNIIGALIGGLIAYLIVLLQIKSLKKQQADKESVEKDEKQIQLLWQIYFDIKKDSENSMLWAKYEELKKNGDNVLDAYSPEYLSETLQYLMRDIRNFFRLLRGKESEINTQMILELSFLWERGAQLLIFMFKIYNELGKKSRKYDTDTMTYYEEANEIYQQHNRTIQKKL